MFYIFQQFQNLDFEVLTVTLLLMINWSILLLYCFFGKVATSSYEDMIDYLYFANWTESPIVLQKEFVILLANAQKPLSYHGFGVVFLNLETFTKVKEDNFLS